MSFAVATTIAAFGGLVWFMGSNQLVATTEEDYLYGYVDPTTGMWLSIQLNPTHADGGAFTVTVPGVGLFIPLARADITVNGNGSRSFEYEGDALFDENADVDATYGIFVQPSDEHIEVRFPSPARCPRTSLRSLSSSSMTTSFTSLRL